MKLTNEQIELVKDEIVFFAETTLGCDNEEAKTIAKDYLYDIVADIEENHISDWSSLNDDEICFHDVCVSIADCLADYNETDEDNYNMD